MQMGFLHALLTGPKLYRIFGEADRTVNIVELIGNNSMSIVKSIFYFSTSLAFSPIILTYLYSRGDLNIHSILTILKYAGYLSILAYSARMIGRAMDSDYREFISLWSKSLITGKSQDNQALKRYDFELYGVVPDFIARQNEKLWYLSSSSLKSNLVINAVSWFAVHSFGRHMLYPGSIRLFNWILSTSLHSARNLMVMVKGGQRAWLQSTEGDLIDTMFIQGDEDTLENRRRILVISCEGNAGFYEIGIANTPGQLGYSVLGWNQPGFGESSGLPFPKNTLAAADAVMQYAQTVLGFHEENIVLFGWSIGGFPASWLAANYPKVKAVILDATFDDVLPLAEARMPKIASGIVGYAIRKYFNLEIHKILARYTGPLRLIRRLQEEILTTDDNGTEEQRRTSNRANFLLKSILKERHPHLLQDLEPQVDRWLSLSPQERALLSGLSHESDASRRLASLFAVCDHYLTDFDATHVQPLDPGYFNIPSKIREL